jgi:hypothetical protein
MTALPGEFGGKKRIGDGGGIGLARLRTPQRASDQFANLFGSHYHEAFAVRSR